MHFNIYEKKKIIFGWSAKCGCSHVKNIYRFIQTGEISSSFPHKYCGWNNPLPKDIQKYTTILVSRNPYERIISGFMEKYVQKKYIWRSKLTLTFSNFVNELIKGKWDIIDRHHFTPQTSECFSHKILDSKYLKCFDIKKIDYKFIEKVSEKEIPKKIVKAHFGQRKIHKQKLNNYVFDLDSFIYSKKNVDFKYFYNKEILNKVYNFYKNDFNFFKDLGIIYTDKEYKNDEST